MVQRQRRLSWLDVAKGGAVILVALFHATFYLGEVDLVHWTYAPLNDVLVQLRMPTFFLASGITTSFLLSRPRDTYVARKILPLIWILVVWSVIRDIALLQFRPFDGDPSTGVGPLIHNMLLSPNAGMWFVWSVAVLSVAALALRRLPWALPAGALLAASVLVTGGVIPTDATPFSAFLVGNFLTYAFLFFVGIGVAGLMTDIGASTRRAAMLLAAGGAGFVAANLITGATGDGAAAAGLTAALRIGFGALFGLAAAMLADRAERLGPWLAWAGKRSLAIYVGHSLFMFWAIRLMPNGLADTLAASPAATLAAPVVLTAVSVAGALALHEVLVRARLGWLYVLPAEVCRSIVTRLTPPAATPIRKDAAAPVR